MLTHPVRLGLQVDDTAGYTVTISNR